MSPPSHLINLMLKVAARITAGEWRGLMFGVDDRGQQIPVQWDWSDDEDQSQQARGGAARSQHLFDDDWLPRNGRKMAGSFPESDDEDNESLGDHEVVSDYDAGPNTISSEYVEPDDDWSQSLGVD
jgi:hypothetical protein